MRKFFATTILGVRKNSEVAMGCDGQVSMGSTIIKEKACKIRKLYGGKVLAGFAGAVADALALFERFEGKLEHYKGNLQKASVELAKEWRTDKVLRRLEALLGVCDKEKSFIISGEGEVIEPDDGIIALGSGGSYALAAARALLKYSNLKPEEIVTEAIQIASSICIYTNKEIIVEKI